MLKLSLNARWSQNGVTVAGGNGEGSATNQLNHPHGFHIDGDNQSIVIADCWNDRIVEWKTAEKNGKVVAGGQGRGNQLDQLNSPTDVLIDKETNSLLIADRDKQRVLQWSRREKTTQGELLINNIRCWGLAMDHQRYLYVSDTRTHEVRRFAIGDSNGTIVAGGNGQGNRLNQLSVPTYLWVDENQAVYVSDSDNHRVMKWNKGAQQGIVVAGGQGQGSSMAQFSRPLGLFVDTWNTLYVADSKNYCVVRWPKREREGTVIVGIDEEEPENQLSLPYGLSFDQQGNLYVVDNQNHRVQRFDIE